jgi:Type II secretion system (T2SS), protein M
VTVRDKIIVGVVAGLVALAAWWFLLLSPERKKADDLGKQVAAQRQTLQKAQTEATASQAARATYAADYATVARLGKAVPVDDDVPSLVWELQSASSRTGVDFRGIKLVPAPGASPAPAPSPPPANGSGGSKSGSKPSSSGQSGTGTTTTPSTGQPPASGSSSNTSSTSGSTPTGSASSPSAPANQAAAAGLPPGATVGSAGLVTMPFSFTFEGDFFHLSDFFRKLERFIQAGPSKLRVNGRLLTVDGISLSADQGDFRHVKATVSATTYLLPDVQGLLGGATPAGPASPAGGTSSASNTGSGSATPAPAAAAATAP